MFNPGSEKAKGILTVNYEQITPSSYAEALMTLRQMILNEEFQQKKESENSFKIAELIRQNRGFDVLKELLKTGRDKIHNILGLSEFPDDFDTKRDWSDSTGEYPFKSTITFNGVSMEVVGIRIQNNLLSRESKGKDCHSEELTPVVVGGGVRVEIIREEEMDPNLEDEMKAEGAALALAMGPKNTGTNSPDYFIDKASSKQPERTEEIRSSRILTCGGAKGDIRVIVPQGVTLSKDDEKAVIALALEEAGYQWAIGGALYTIEDGKLIISDRMAGDKNTTCYYNGHPVIEHLLVGIERALKKQNATDIQVAQAKALVSGKSVKNGGIEARFDATGFGGWESFRAYTEEKGIELKGLRVFFRGCGSAASRAIQEAYKAGCIVTGIADAYCVLHCETGFTDQDAKDLFEVSVNQRRSIAEWARTQKNSDRSIIVFGEPQGNGKSKSKQLKHDIVTRYFSRYAPNVIFEAATQGTLDRDTAQFVPYGAIVVELANGPTTPLAAEILKNKGVVIIVAILANSGGVRASWYEYLKAHLPEIDELTTEEIEEVLSNMMHDNIRDTIELVELASERGYELTLEEAYYTLAIARALKMKNEYQQSQLKD